MLQKYFSTSIIIAWDPVPLTDQNGIITTYEILYRWSEIFSYSIKTQTVIVPGYKTSTMLEDLQEFVEYNILMRAYTKEGAGPYGETEKIRTPEDRKYYYTYYIMPLAITVCTMAYQNNLISLSKMH